MKFLLPIVAFVGATTAQLPECAVPCINAAVQKVGCALGDLKCSCSVENKSRIRLIAAPCVIEACGSDVAINVVLPEAERMCGKDDGSTRGEESGAEEANGEAHAEEPAPSSTADEDEADSQPQPQPQTDTIKTAIPTPTATPDDGGYGYGNDAGADKGADGADDGYGDDAAGKADDHVPCANTTTSSTYATPTQPPASVSTAGCDSLSAPVGMAAIVAAAFAYFL